MSHRWGENTGKQTPERESFSNLTTGRIPHRKQGKIPEPDTVQEDPWVARAEHTKHHPTWRVLPDWTASVAEASEMATPGGCGQLGTPTWRPPGEAVWQLRL